MIGLFPAVHSLLGVAVNTWTHANSVDFSSHECSPTSARSMAFQSETVLALLLKQSDGDDDLGIESSS